MRFNGRFKPVNTVLTVIHKLREHGKYVRRLGPPRWKQSQRAVVPITPESVERDFVTHQAIHTYLTTERGATLPDHDGDAVNRKIETVEKLQGRIAAVTESAIASLAASGELDRDAYDVLVDVRAVCPECGSDYPAGELFRRGGCDCQREE